MDDNVNVRRLLCGTKNEKSKDYCKADLKQRVLFFITIFRLAIPAFFRFTDVLLINLLGIVLTPRVCMGD